MTFEKVFRMLKIEYEKAMRANYVKKPLSWALYNVWKMVDAVEMECEK